MPSKARTPTTPYYVRVAVNARYSGIRLSTTVSEHSLACFRPPRSGLDRQSGVTNDSQVVIIPAGTMPELAALHCVYRTFVRP